MSGNENLKETENGEEGEYEEGENINNGDLYVTSSNLSYNKHSYLQRLFGPIREGSLRGATFAMCSITFGAGCLLFPGAVRITGPIIAVILFAIVSSLSYYTEKILVESALKENVFDYDKLIELKLGHGMVIFYDINNIVFTIGVIMSYQKGTYEFGLNLLEYWFGIDKTRTDAKLYLMLASYCFAQIPLGLLKNISKIQYASIVATISLIYCVVVVAVEMPFYLVNYIKEGNTIPLYNSFDWSKNNYFDTFATFLFGFACHNGILQVLSEVKLANERRCKKILRNSFLIEIFLYSTMAFCGYFSTFDKTPDFYITRPDLPGFTDYFIVFAQLTLFVCLHCVLAINYNIMRSSYRSICFGGNDINFYVDFMICVATIGFCNVVVFYLETIIDIIGMFAGFSNIIICFLNPVLIYSKTFFDRFSYKQILPFSILGFMTITGSICTVKSMVICIKNIIDTSKK